MIYNCDELSFQILTVDRFAHQAGCFDVRPRPFAALSYRVSGTGAFEIGGKHLITRPGDVLFVPANTPYKVHYSVSESIVLHLGACNYHEAENITPVTRGHIEGRFLQLMAEWKERRSVNRAKATAYEILDLLANDRQMSVEDSVIADCVRYIGAHFCDHDLRIEQVCAAAFLSASTLRRAFLQHLGMTPKQYLMRLRMNHALALLTEGRHSVKQVASACGFPDEKYFSRAFKKHYGFPPSLLQDRPIL